MDSRIDLFEHVTPRFPETHANFPVILLPIAHLNSVARTIRICWRDYSFLTSVTSFFLRKCLVKIKDLSSKLACLHKWLSAVAFQQGLAAIDASSRPWKSMIETSWQIRTSTISGIIFMTERRGKYTDQLTNEQANQPMGRRTYRGTFCLRTILS